MGSTFTLAFVIDRSAQLEPMADTAAQAHVAPAIVMKNLRILVVDDATLVRKMVAKSLVQGGYCETGDVEMACDGAEGLEKMMQSMEDARVYDAVIIDCIMPNMTGHRATQEARARGYAGIVVGFTGNALESDVEEFLAHGVDAVMTKPMLIEDFIRVLAPLHQKQQER